VSADLGVKKCVRRVRAILFRLTLQKQGGDNVSKDSEQSTLLSAAMNKWQLIVLLLVTPVASFTQAHSPSAELKPTSPDLNLIVQSLERIERQNLARFRPYEVARQYKAFRGGDKRSTSEVTAEVSFTPPNRKTFKITQASGNARGEKIVRDLLEQETESGSGGKNRDVSRTNYDFVFLRQENFGLVLEYVLAHHPKTQGKGSGSWADLGRC